MAKKKALQDLPSGPISPRDAAIHIDRLTSRWEYIETKAVEAVTAKLDEWIAQNRAEVASCLEDIVRVFWKYAECFNRHANERKVMIGNYITHFVHLIRTTALQKNGQPITPLIRAKVTCIRNRVLRVSQPAESEPRRHRVSYY